MLSLAVPLGPELPAAIPQPSFSPLGCAPVGAFVVMASVSWFVPWLFLDASGTSIEVSAVVGPLLLVSLRFLPGTESVLSDGQHSSLKRTKKKNTSKDI